MTMKSNVLPKRMTAHLCRGSNSPVVSLHVVCGVWCVVGVCGGGGYGGGGGGGGGGGDFQYGGVACVAAFHITKIRLFLKGLF